MHNDMFQAQYSDAIDSSSSYLLCVLIYEPDNENCDKISHVCKILAAEYPRVKFIRATSTLLGMSKAFKEQALPTLQFYSSGNLVGNFVQFISILGPDFTADQLKSFLRKKKPKTNFKQSERQRSASGATTESDPDRVSSLVDSLTELIETGGDSFPPGYGRFSNGLLPFDDDATDLGLPLAVLFLMQGSFGNKLLFMHPFEHYQAEHSNKESEGEKLPPPPTATVTSSVSSSSQSCPPPQVYYERPELEPKREAEHEHITQFGLTTTILGLILCMEKCVNQKFEVKIDNYIFCGYPMKISESRHTTSIQMFHVAFVLPGNVDSSIIESFQELSTKLALALNSLQVQNGYLIKEEKLMSQALEIDDEANSAAQRSERDPTPVNAAVSSASANQKEHPMLTPQKSYDEERKLLESNPFIKVLENSKLAVMLYEVYEKVRKTGVVRMFIDDHVEIGFCFASRAMAQAHLTPKHRNQIENQIKRIRPYHGVLLIEDIWPSPDSNNLVTLFLQHCSPDRSMQDIALASNIPLTQVFLIVQHLLLWARAVVIYPLCNSNVYTSASLSDKPISQFTKKFRAQFGTNFNLGVVLSHFNPPIRLGDFQRNAKYLADQQLRAKVVVSLLRHQLIMQLHKFCYILPPYSNPKRRVIKECPQKLKVSK
ncbi:hypothetical protein WR25_06666 isoform B [Diploscapter pachys]|uniref:GATOR complex protein NPRL3 n=2 Tax=Diploscapter pachys TaxID=2018661 RepID=A0A2A2KT38_9BILA|nr:hypothetical protein WR25_06666 isoform B [Diploscapter pachys]